MQPTLMMSIAYIISQNSKCSSWRVGALIERDGRIISTGYNGTLAGKINCCDHSSDNGWTTIDDKGVARLKPEHRKDHSTYSVLYENHAEANAIAYAARYNGNLNGSTIYVTISPCNGCIKQIVAAGIKRVVYCELYDRASPGWDDLLISSGVEVVQIPKSSLTCIDWNNVENFLLLNSQN